MSRLHLPLLLSAGLIAGLSHPVSASSLLNGTPAQQGCTGMLNCLGTAGAATGQRTTAPATPSYGGLALPSNPAAAMPAGSEPQSRVTGPNAASGTAQTDGTGVELELPDFKTTIVGIIGPDNRYSVPGNVNGTSVDFVLDPSAAGILVSPEMVRENRIADSKQSVVALGSQVRIQRLVVGPYFLTNVPARVVDARQLPSGKPVVGRSLMDRFEITEGNGIIMLKKPGR